MQHGHLQARADHMRQWDAELEVADGPGAALLGFMPGQHQRVPYGGFKNIVRWLMWPGVAMMVTAGLLGFFMQWRTVLRAFSGLMAMFKKGKGLSAHEDALAAVDVPGSWFAMGVVITGPGGRHPPDVVLRHPLVDGRPRGDHVLLPRHRRVPRHGRDGHHPRGRHGQDHPAHVRRRRPGQHHRQPHDRERDRGRGHLLGGPAPGLAVRLHGRGQPAQAVRRHAPGRHRGLGRRGARLQHPRAQRRRPGHGQAPGPRGPDVVRGGHAALQRAPRPARVGPLGPPLGRPGGHRHHPLRAPLAQEPEVPALPPRPWASPS